MDKTSMSYWFPLLDAADLPVPRTKCVSMPVELCRSILMILYGEKPEIDPRNHPFFGELRAAVEEVGTPCFLRTAMTSAKHSWDKSCFVPDVNCLVRHVYEIAEFSEIADICGLPYDSWFVRELLPSIKFGTCPDYGNMPVAREFRFFVENGKIRCFHPYWPLEPLRDGGWKGSDDDFIKLCDPGKDELALRDLALKVSASIPGAWSVDILETERGWYVTDMAEAHKSFHWEGCEASPIHV
jgi:hypothetical protein